MCPREPARQSCYMPSHRFQWNFGSFKGLPQNSKRQTGFPGFHQGNRFKICKMYEILTSMVFNQLLWGFAHVFLHPWLMSAVSISQFYWRLVNQQRQINDCVFRLFDSSKYLTTLRSNISPCQKATTLILIPHYNPSFHFWKSSKKSLVATVFLSWMSLISTPVTSCSQLHLSRNSCSGRSLNQINLYLLALYTRWLMKKGKKWENLSRLFVGMENFTFREMQIGEKSMGKS